MRLIVAALLFAGCAGAEVVDTGEVCSNITREFNTGVPFEWAVHDEEVNTKMDNGCTLTTITHYVLEDNNASSGGGGGSLPIAYWERGCGVDGCGGPIDHGGLVSNPSEVAK